MFTHKPMQHESTFLTRNYRDHHAAVFSRPSCGKSLFGAYGCAAVYAVRFNFSWEQAISKKLANVTTLLSIIREDGVSQVYYRKAE